MTGVNRENRPLPVYNVVHPIATAVMAIINLDTAAIRQPRRTALFSVLFVRQPLEAIVISVKIKLPLNDRKHLRSFNAFTSDTNFVVVGFIIAIKLGFAASDVPWMIRKICESRVFVILTNEVCQYSRNTCHRGDT